MKIKFIAALAASVLMLASCDETTNTLGITLNTTADNLAVASNTFKASSRSVAIESVISRSTIGYLGRIQDPETGAHISGDFMTQFACLEGFKMMPIDSLTVRDSEGHVMADSCEIRLFYSSYYGDSLATMKMKVYELDHPMMEDQRYYSDFDPLEAGYVRTDGIAKEKVYSLVNTSEAEEKKNNGLYVNFRNSYTFLKNVQPGFFFKMTGGQGSMAYIVSPQLNIYYKAGSTAAYATSRMTLFNGTEEVLQTTTVTNEDAALQELVADNSCTYIKSPSGIFTEITLPVDEIMVGHENDTINTAKMYLNRLNNESWNKFALPAPSTLLLVEADSLSTFFENSKLANHKTSYLAAFTSATNRYTFGNISNLIASMYRAKINGLRNDPNWVAHHPNWNKVMAVPVKTNYITYNNSSVLTSVTNDMSLTSTRLVGGSTPINIEVIYSKFE